jgi:hypothetical protein
MAVEKCITIINLEVMIINQNINKQPGTFFTCDSL